MGGSMALTQGRLPSTLSRPRQCCLRTCSPHSIPSAHALASTSESLIFGQSSKALCPRRVASIASTPRRRAGVAAAGFVTTALLSRELSAEEDSQWKASCEVLSGDLGLGSDECQQLLAKAFGWTSQAFWRREKIEELPTPGQVGAVLAFLRDELEMVTDEQRKVVKVFPEVLACDVDGRLRANISQLRSQWRLQGSTLTKAVLRQPPVLGYSVDCGGDCIGECNRCWARF